MKIQRISYLFLTLFISSFLNANEFRMITNEEPPTNYLDKNKKIVGITVDVVNKLKEELNIKNDIELLTWARAYTTSQNNPNIAIFTAGKTLDRIKEGFHFIGPIVTKKHVLFSKKSRNLDISTTLDIEKQNLKIGAMQGDWRAKYFQDKGFFVHEVSNHEQNINKLMLGRIDLWTSSTIEAPVIAKKANISIDDLNESYTFQEIGSYIMLSKRTSKEEVIRWEIAYENLQKTDFFEKTAKKWSDILQIELLYSKDKGFYKK